MFFIQKILLPHKSTSLNNSITKFIKYDKIPAKKENNRETINLGFWDITVP